jgi:2-(1,2-epoxy-1,2-dihydrophenyl)acetyl-CoA isomerase
MAEMLHDRVSWDLQNGVARITLARGAGNALDMATAQGVREAAQRVARGALDGSVRVAVLAARGSTFCVGGDLHEFASATDRGTQVTTVADELHRAILTLSGASVPVVSVVHGTVAGGGIGLALAADIVLMAAEATLVLAYTAAGLTPDCGSTWTLARRLGTARALDLALTNRPLTGGDAAAWGLISRAVPADQLAQVADEVVAALRSGPVHAYAETKRLMAAAAQRDLPTQLADESATIGKLIVGADATEGVNAFLEKRTPSFG